MVGPDIEFMAQYFALVNSDLKFSQARRLPQAARRTSTRRARSAAAPWLSREATHCHAGRSPASSVAPRAPAASLSLIHIYEPTRPY